MIVSGENHKGLQEAFLNACTGVVCNKKCGVSVVTIKKGGRVWAHKTED